MAEIFATFGINGKLLLVQVVNFSVLLGALTYLLYKPVLSMLEERRRVIAQGVRDAEKAGEALRSAGVERDALVGAAAREAEHIVARAREHAVSRGAEIETEAKVRAERLLKEAIEKGDALKDAALKESDAAIARAAVLAAEKILAKS